MKRYIFYLAVCLMGLSMQAKERTETERFSIAQEHFDKHIPASTRTSNAIRLVGSASQILGSSTTRTTGNEAFYIYNYGESAFVIVSGDDQVKPVLGYSDHGSFVTENMPSNLKGWLTLYTQLPHQTEQPKQKQPLRLLNKTSRAADASFPATVSPLLGEIAWNQDAPFNNLCPEQSVTGCVATAMGMIMKYHEYPKMGKGRHSYVSAPHNYSCSYDYEEKAFDWKNMLPQYVEGEYNETQSNAVAELMKACGVSVNMSYDPYSSAASALKVAHGMTTYFKYNSNMQFRLRDAYTSAEWMSLIKKELSEQRPVLYNGASKEVGHEFVFDGYDEQDMVHINWGWGGLSNGYFEVATLDPLNPGIGGGSSSGGGYTYSQGMVTGIKPETDAAEASHSWYMTALMMLSEPNEKGQLPITQVVSVGAVTMANYGTTFNGEAGIILSSEVDGEPLGILGKQTLASIDGGTGGNLQFNFTIPEDTKDGIYCLYLAAKAFKAERWERIRTTVGYMPYIVIKIADGMVTYYDPRQQPDLSGSYSIEGKLTVNKYGNFAIQVKNEGNEYYYGSVGVLITPSTTSPEAAIYLDEVHLAPGEERTVSFTKALVNTEDSYIEEGTSMICGVYTYGEALFPLTDFSTVEIGYSKLPKLTLTEKLATAKPVFEVGEEFVMPVSLTCEGDYNQYLVAAIFPYGATITNTQVAQEVSLTDGQTFSTTLRGYIAPELKEGKYLVGLYYYDISTGSYSGELGFTTFEVVLPTGIETGTAQPSVIIYPQPVTDYVHIRCKEAINQLEVINLAGQQVKKEQMSTVPKEECSLSVANLPAGYYILLIHTDNGVYKKKFIKK